MCVCAVCMWVPEVGDRKTCQFSSIQSRACFAIAAPLQVSVHSIQFNSMKTCMRWMANCVAATQRHRHTELEHLVIHTANGSVGIVPHTLDVINNLRWKSKPDFWFSFFIFSHISSTRASALARCHLSIC